MQTAARWAGGEISGLASRCHLGSISAVLERRVRRLGAVDGRQKRRGAGAINPMRASHRHALRICRSAACSGSCQGREGVDVGKVDDRLDDLRGDVPRVHGVSACLVKAASLPVVLANFVVVLAGGAGLGRRRVARARLLSGTRVRDLGQGAAGCLPLRGLKSRGGGPLTRRLRFCGGASGCFQSPRLRHLGRRPFQRLSALRGLGSRELREP